jgi:hypothetical protein
MRDEDSQLECGIVYKQILINVKLQTGRSGQKTMTGEVYEGGEGIHIDTPTATATYHLA